MLTIVVAVATESLAMDRISEAPSLLRQAFPQSLVLLCWPAGMVVSVQV